MKALPVVSIMIIHARPSATLASHNACTVVGGGGGAGYTGGAGGSISTDLLTPPSTALAGTSFLAASVSDACFGLPGN